MAWHTISGRNGGGEAVCDHKAEEESNGKAAGRHCPFGGRLGKALSLLGTVGGRHIVLLRKRGGHAGGGRGHCQTESRRPMKRRRSVKQAGVDQEATAGGDGVNV